MKRTKHVIQIAAALMADPDAHHHGYALGGETGLRSGVLYPVLHRMLEEGWLEDGWEEQPANGRRTRPPRRYYTLTDLGRQELGAMPAPAPSPRALRRPRPATS
jgi:PadR family transcriptional regulator PadR